jgi:hypothetical protein
MKKRKKAKKTFSFSRLFNPHTRTNRKRISFVRRTITNNRILISIAACSLIIISYTAAYALMNSKDLASNNAGATSTTNTSASSKSKFVSSSTSNEPTVSNPANQSQPETCSDITAAAETQYLESTGSLVFPHYGDSLAVYNAYNNAYQNAYNTYVSTVKAHNCTVTIADRGTVQYAGPSCTPAYANNIIVVLKNDIYSAYNLDMAEYNRWLIAGHDSDPSFYPTYAAYLELLDGEQKYIQNEDNNRVNGYVSETNVSLAKIYCPAINPANYYNKMF